MVEGSIYIENECYGKIGKKVPAHLHSLSEDLHVGDLVFFKYGDKVDSGIVLNHERPNTYAIYGYWYLGFDLDDLKIAYKYQELNEQNIINSTKAKRETIKIVKDDVKEHTLEEIQRLLGYKIKIVK